jgi:hypothetical protein
MALGNIWETAYKSCCRPISAARPYLAFEPSPNTGNKKMSISSIGVAHLQPIASLIAGILILIMPQLLNYIVAIFLIVSGILGLGLIH